MNRVPIPVVPNRVPDPQSERRLLEIRKQAETHGAVTGRGIVPAGAPFPKASPETGYYGVPMLKEPQWTWEVPLYFFVGGAAGAASIIATVASLSDAEPELVRSARWVAAAGGAISPVLLISDLGRRERFMNMMRVFKLQSAMNVGAWTLAAFSTFAGAAAFANFVRDHFGDSLPVRLLEDASGVMTSAAGAILSTYTGVLIGATAVPVWNENVGTLPHHFAASGVNSAVSLLELMGHENKSLNHLGIVASAYEVYEGIALESRRTIANEPVHKGRSGIIVRAGAMLSGPVPLALRLAHALTGRTSFRRAAAWSSLAGSLLTRYGWIDAGHASSKDHRIPLMLDKSAPEIRKSSHQLVVDKAS